MFTNANIQTFCKMYTGIDNTKHSWNCTWLFCRSILTRTKNVCFFFSPFMYFEILFVNITSTTTQYKTSSRRTKGRNTLEESLQDSFIQGCNQVERKKARKQQSFGYILTSSEDWSVQNKKWDYVYQDYNSVLYV